MNVNVTQPAKYAPDIQVAVYDWDQWSGDDLIGRFPISFQHCLDMCVSGRPEWFKLQSHDGEPASGELYLACEFIESGMQPVFKMNRETKVCFVLFFSYVFLSCLVLSVLRNFIYMF